MKQDLSKFFSKKKSFRRPIVDSVTSVLTAVALVGSAAFSAAAYYTTAQACAPRWVAAVKATPVAAWQQYSTAMPLEGAAPEEPQQGQVIPLSVQAASSQQNLYIDVYQAIEQGGISAVSPATGLPITVVLECKSLTPLEDESHKTDHPLSQVGAVERYELDQQSASLEVDGLTPGEYALTLSLPQEVLEQELEEGETLRYQLPEEQTVFVAEKIEYKVVQVQVSVATGNETDDPDAEKQPSAPVVSEEPIPDTPSQPAVSEPSSEPSSGSDPGSGSTTPSEPQPIFTQPGWQRYNGNTYYIKEDLTPATGMTKVDGNLYCFNAGGELFVNCIDISSWNGDVDWQQVAASGVKYAVIRVGYRGWGEAGALREDANALANLRGAKAAGIQVGAYFFSQAITAEEGREEASAAVQVIQNSGVSLSLPIYCDSEWGNSSHTGRADGISAAQRTEAVVAFCETIKSAGYSTGIYCSSSWVGSCLNAAAISGYPLWIANWSTPNAGSHMQQYASDGNGAGNYNKVPGVPTLVDLNYYYPSGDMGKGVLPTPQPVEPQQPVAPQTPVEVSVTIGLAEGGGFQLTASASGGSGQGYQYSYTLTGTDGSAWASGENAGASVSTGAAVTPQEGASYTVCVTATDSLGASATATESYTVPATPGGAGSAAAVANSG